MKSERTSKTGRSIEDLISDLTARELQVFNLLATGDTNRQLAQQLGIAERTLRAHITAMMRKLGLLSRMEAALLSQRQQIGGTLSGGEEKGLE